VGKIGETDKKRGAKKEKQGVGNRGEEEESATLKSTTQNPKWKGKNEDPSV
jgi:hypothetical protein